jgi:hypothetical protein
MNRGIGTRLLSELGSILGMPALAPEADGGCRLRIDEFVVDLRLDEAGERLLLEAVVGELLPGGGEGALITLLGANRVAAADGGPVFALAADARQVLLAQSLAASALTGDDLAAWIGRLIDTAEAWRPALDGAVAAPENLHPSSMSHMIRA